MTVLQQIGIILCAILNLFILLKGFHKTKNKKDAFGTTPFLLPLGIFVWGDAVVLSLFWILTALITLVSHSWNLFLLVLSVFWFIRSFGEVIYWLNQQFSNLSRNPPAKLLLHDIFHNDSIWFAYQLFWQCIMLASLIFTIYFAHKWLTY